MRARAVALLAGAGVILVGCADGTETRPESREQLAALQAEPVVAYRAPGTQLQLEQSRAGGVIRNPIGPDEVVHTEVGQTFGVPGDPADTIDRYLGQAADSGWRLIETSCSAPERAARAVLLKDFPTFTASLVLTGYSPLPPAHRQLTVVLAVRPAPEPRYEPGTLRCVRDVRPDDPDLAAASSTPNWASAELCALLPLAQAKAIVPAIDRAVAELSSVTPTCTFLTADRSVLGRPIASFAVRDAFDTPRAVYLDRRHPASPSDEGDRVFLLTSDVGPSLVGAYIATTRGPIELRIRDVDPQIALALARAIQARAG